MLSNALNVTARRTSRAVRTAPFARSVTSIVLPNSSYVAFGQKSSASHCTKRNFTFVTNAGTLNKLRSSPHINSAAQPFSTSGEVENMEFQAETRKLLDIVTHSIYTDKEVFIRELISNASDALEKFRYSQVTGEVTVSANSGDPVPLEVNIITDPIANTLTIVDNGIGMSKEELVANLGTIARSGSKRFVESVEKSESAGGDAANGIIGQFGVGFYSSFMVADAVSVESISASSLSHESEGVANKWSSDGSGTFQVEAVAPASLNDMHGKHGSKVVMKLKESCKEYSDSEKIKEIIKKYSNFVSFPIKIDGETVNTVSAIWAEDKSNVTEEQYGEFYKFISSGFDSPKYRLHFRSDAPIDLKVLFYVPTFHEEKFGMGRTALGVNLYSRKVLIESKPKDLLPEWLRFIKGAVDSEDLPLSLSREKPQDSGLLRRIRDVLTRKLLRFFSDEMKNNLDSYKEFYLEYHMFLKEGVCQDYQFVEQLSKLLLFDSSTAGEVVSLDSYLSRCSPDQKHIYYLVAPNREAALKSPYYETFKKHDREVLFLYNTIDDFVMSNIKTFGGKTLTSAETSTVDLASEMKGTKEGSEDSKNEKDDKSDDSNNANKKATPSTADIVTLTDTEASDFCAWMTSTLGSKVREVRVTKRLSDSPAIVTDHQSGALRRMMKMVEQANAGAAAEAELPPQVIEVNPSHPLIVRMYAQKDDPRSSAHLVAEQLLDNCLIAAGLIEDPRYMLPRLNDLLLATLQDSSSEGDGTRDAEVV